MVDIFFQYFSLNWKFIVKTDFKIKLNNQFLQIELYIFWNKLIKLNWLD